MILGKHVVCSVLCLLPLATLVIPAEKTFAADRELRFSWAVLLDTADGIRAIDFSKPEVLKSGDTFQIYLKPEENVYIYLYLEGPGKSFDLIFPQSFSLYNQEVIASTMADMEYFVPEGENRFQLTPPGGQERFLLLASATRLSTLEQLTGAFQQDPDNQRKRAAFTKELKKLRRSHSTLAQTTETGVPIAGTIFRSTPGSNEKRKVIQVSADSFYSKVLRLKHE